MKMGEAIYKAQQAKPEGGAEGAKTSDGEKKEDVVDAEFEEVKDSKEEKKEDKKDSA